MKTWTKNDRRTGAVLAAIAASAVALAASSARAMEVSGPVHILGPSHIRVAGRLVRLDISGMAWLVNEGDRVQCVDTAVYGVSECSAGEQSLGKAWVYENKN